ncbi:MAG: Uma2 family endonuclease [Alphaproteobacteria bacterium]|nr:Uma2 family endonuclease [Alphaproteobacteria bacterium]
MSEATMALQDQGQDGGLPRRREELEEVYAGRMGSTFLRWRFQPGELEAVLGHDWSRLGRRLFIDPERGEVTVMETSARHAVTAELVAFLLGHSTLALSIQLVATGRTTWSAPGSRRIEADNSFYLGSSAERLLSARRNNEMNDDEFARENPPELVVEMERSHGDAGRSEAYRSFGVAEMWRIDAGSDHALSVEILNLHDGARAVERSAVLPGLTPEVIGRVLEVGRTEGPVVMQREVIAAGIRRRALLHGRVWHGPRP